MLVWAEFHNKLRSFNAKPPDALRGRVSLDDYRERLACKIAILVPYLLVMVPSFCETEGLW